MANCRQSWFLPNLPVSRVNPQFLHKKAFHGIQRTYQWFFSPMLSDMGVREWKEAVM